MKTTNKDFQFFKKCCQKWIVKFELNSWDVSYIHRPNKRDISSVSINLGGYQANVNLSTTWDGILPLDEKNLDLTAKHEMIHLLMGRFAGYAKARYLSLSEMEEAEEELTNKLVNII